MGFYYNKFFSIILGCTFIITFTSCEFSNDLPLSKDIYTYKTTSKDSLSIQDAIKISKKGFFKKSKTYKKTKDSTLWCLLEIQKGDLNKNNDNFLVGSDPFINSGKAFIIKNKSSKIIELHKFVHNKQNAFDFIFYRTAAWKLPKEVATGDTIFLKLKGHSLRNRIDFFIHDLNSFLKISQLEYYWYGIITAFLLSLSIILLGYSILIREYSIIYYVLYVFFLVLDFYSSRGLGKQFFWSSNDFLMQNRSYPFLLASTFISFFFIYFYQYNSKNVFFRKIFKFFASISLVAVILSVLNYYVKIHDNFTGITFNSLQLIALIYLVIHIILAKRKQIPVYLALGFSIPFVVLIIYQLLIPYLETGGSLISRFLFLNLPYIAFTLEITVISFYIFDRMVKVQRRYFKLKRINNSLRRHVNNMALETELSQRKKLLNSIHDSFGGSIEALKYRLRNDNSISNIENVIDNFSDQYRFILKNLDNPQIDSNNIETYMINYAEELEQIFSIQFKTTISLINFFVNKAYCMHIYLSYCELITNAIKHSKASKIGINAFTDNHFLILKVSDNGIGFKNTKKLGYGINSIKDRTNKFGGEFYIEQSTSGSVITLKLPLKHE